MRKSVIDRIRSFSRRTYGRWIYQFLFVVLVILAISSSVLLFLLSSIDDNLNQINSNLVSSLKMDIESKLYDIQHYVASFSTSYLTGVLSNGFDEESLINSANGISDILKGYCRVNSLISHMHVYYPDLDIITGDQGAFKARHYYALLNKNSTEGVNEYLEYFANIHPGFSIIWRDGKPILCLTRLLRTNTITFGVIVVELDSDQLLYAVTNSQIDTTRFQNEFAVIYDGIIIATSTDSDIIGQSVDMIMSRLPETKKIVVLDSNIKKLEYVGLFNSITLDHQMFLSRVIVCTFLLFMVLFGVLTSIFFAKKNWKPVQQIMEKLDIEQVESSSDLEQVNNKIEKILNDYTYSEEKLTEYISIVSAVFLSSVLSGKKNKEQDIVDFANAFGVEFDLPCFVMVTVIGKDLEKIVSHLQCHLDFGSNLICCIQDEKLYIYVGLDDTENQQTARFVLEPYIDASEYFIGIGSKYDSLDNIIYSAREGYSLYKSGLCGIHSYSGEPLANTRYEDDEKLLDLFLKNINEKRYSQAISMIKDVFDHYFGTKEISSAELEMKFQGLKDKITSQAKNIPISAFDYSSKQALMDCTIQILGSLNDSGDHELPQKVMSIIKKNYKDSQFGLFSISQELNISNSYLSTKFKNEFGIGIAKCIGNLRMEEAKRLILTTDLPIREIALNVGFSSDIAFLRAFKRIEQTTPTNLRKQSKTNE